MGAYTWFSDHEFDNFSSVADNGINEALQEVRSVMPEWYIQERVELKSRWFKKPLREYHYSVYHRSKPDYSEARLQISATTRGEILNLLYGLYMGYHKAKEDEKL